MLRLHLGDDPRMPTTPSNLFSTITTGVFRIRKSTAVHGTTENVRNEKSPAVVHLRYQCSCRRPVMFCCLHFHQRYTRLFVYMCPSPVSGCQNFLTLGTRKKMLWTAGNFSGTLRTINSSTCYPVASSCAAFDSPLYCG